MTRDAELASHLVPCVTDWEEAERLGKPIWTPAIQHSRHAWSVNLDHYIRCFWLVGLALALNVDEALWQRLLALIGNEGEDALLDRVIASRQPGRKIGATLCHPKPYQRLLDAINAPKPKQPLLLKAFVEHWYQALDSPPEPGMSRATKIWQRPYWYEFHKVEGAYFGYWCIEAVAAVKAFGIDDTPCCGLPHYPGDLLRPDGPTTHPTPTPALQVQIEKQIEPHVSLGDRLRGTLIDFVRRH